MANTSCRGREFANTVKVRSRAKSQGVKRVGFAFAECKRTHVAGIDHSLKARSLFLLQCFRLQPKDLRRTRVMAKSDCRLHEIFFDGMGICFVPR